MSETMRLLLVEDNPADARLLREVLAEVPNLACEVSHAARLSEAVTLLRAAAVDVILLDLSLPDSQGLDTVRAVHAEAGPTPIVVLTGLDDEATGVAAVRKGAQDFLVKGSTDPRLLARAIRYAIERGRSEAELARYRDHLEELVAQRTAALEATNRVLQDQMLERQHAQEALEAARRRLMNEEERQRRTLAAALHDSVGQEIVGLKLTLANLVNTEKQCFTTAAIEVMRHAMDTCMLLTREVRNISHGLYPPALEALGLVASLKQLAQAYRTEGEILVESPADLESARFSPEVEVAVFRIAQEALQNALRHSGAAHVSVLFEDQNGTLRLTVVDDGVGFDIEKAAGRGLGLLAMKERALSVRGSLRINSHRGETRVEARIPIVAAPADVKQESQA